MVEMAKMRGFTQKEASKLKAALELAHRVVADPRYLARLREFKKYRSLQLGFENTDDSADKIFGRLTATEIWLDFEIRSYPWWMTWKKSEVARDGATGPIFNRRHYPNQTVPELTGTIIHETLHKLDYKHDPKPSDQRNHSAPYAAGILASQVAELILHEAIYYPPSAPRVAVESLV